MKSTKFGALHSAQDLHLIQQSIEIGPAVPRINIVDVPGANGGKDMTEALGIGVTFEDRTLTWVFAPYPGQDWGTTRRQVENALNGKSFQIELEEEPGWLYTGRVSMDSYKTDQILHQITVTAICRPYKKKSVATVKSWALSSTAKNVTVDIGYEPLVPVFNMTGNTTIVWAGKTYTAGSGDHIWPDMRMSGSQALSIKGSGTLKMTYTEGSL